MVSRRPSPDTASVAEIARLPNLGPKSAEILAGVGIRTVEDLRRTGAIPAYVMAKKAGKNISVNLLWALEGALTGQPWQEVARVHRTSLLLALEEFEKGG